MKNILLLIFVLFSFSSVKSQSINSVIEKISFEKDSLRSAFDWVANNIKYDTKKLKKIESGKKSSKGEFKTKKEFDAMRLKEVIKSKKGVCDHYTLLFDAIVKELGYSSFIVTGVTKNKNGKLNLGTGHSWNAVKVRGQWKLFDPTWAAGYVDGRKFKKKYNDKWYETRPEDMIQTHYPFDPIWQMMPNSVPLSEFKKRGQLNIEASEGDINQSIDAHLELDRKTAMQAELSRSEVKGNAIKLIRRYRSTLQKNLDQYENMDKADLISEVFDNCKLSGDLFNEYMKNGRSKQFKGKTWTLFYSKNQLQKIITQLEDSILTLEEMDVKKTQLKRSIRKSSKGFKELLNFAKKEMEFVDKMIGQEESKQ